MRSVKKKSFALDIFFNYLSLLVGGVSGIVINIYISYFYGPQGLGVFNQIYAIYIILSQLAVGGVHLSALKYIASWRGSSFYLSKIAWSSFWVALFISTFFAIMCYVASFALFLVFKNPEIAQGVRYTALALVFFSCNKVMLFTLNALREMRLLAFWQGIRFLLMILFVIILTRMNANPATLGLTFTFSEGILFLGLLITNIYKLPLIQKGFNTNWIRTHFLFGLRGFANGLILEVNTRVDILLLGILTNDVTVGLYSFASMLIEGIVGFLVVIRNQLNPILARLLKENKKVEIISLFQKTFIYMYGFSFLFFCLAAVMYVPVFSWVLNLNSFLESRSFFLILLSGLCLYSAYFPFENILMLSGYPGRQSFLAFFSTMTNVFLNICLIPIWGGYGAAIATAISICMTMVYLKFMINKCLNFKLQFSISFFKSLKKV